MKKRHTTYGTTLVVYLAVMSLLPLMRYDFYLEIVEVDKNETA